MKFLRGLNTNCEGRTIFMRDEGKLFDIWVSYATPKSSKNSKNAVPVSAFIHYWYNQDIQRLTNNIQQLFSVPVAPSRFCYFSPMLTPSDLQQTISGNSMINRQYPIVYFCASIPIRQTTGSWRPVGT